MNPKKKKLLRAVVITVICIAVLFGACGVYVSIYYKADDAAVAAWLDAGGVQPVTEDNLTLFAPEDPVAGLIFYPGGKVDHEAYYPLMQACADRGILCVLVEMPFRLAVLDMNAADGIAAQYPEVPQWYMGGHSLGGSMAASYLGDHADAFEGLILLGAYSTEDLSRTELDVLSVYGSEDNVMNRKKYASCIAHLPDSYTEVVIDGGCHAYFGLYGMQDGDGTPSITPKDQIVYTADLLASFMAMK